MTKTKSAATAKTTTSSKPVTAAKAPTAAKVPAKPAKMELVTLRQLAASIGEAHGLSESQANGVLASTVSLIGEHLKKGARIRIAGKRPPWGWRSGTGSS